MMIIRPARRVAGQIELPGDKSIAHRALLLAALAEGRSVVHRVPAGADLAATRRVLRRLGVPVALAGPDGVALTGGALREPEGVLDAGNAGTLARLLLGVLAAEPFVSVVSGDASLRRRPMGRVTGPLERMGVVILGRSGGDRLPVAIRGGRLQGVTHELPVASAQVKGALLLAGVRADGVTTVVEPAQSRDHTERLLAALGVPVALVGPDGVAVTDKRSVGRDQHDVGSPRPARMRRLSSGDPHDVVSVEVAGRMPARRDPQEGVSVEVTGRMPVRRDPQDVVSVEVTGPARWGAFQLDVPGDLSSAAPFVLAAILLPRSRLRIDRVGLNPTRTGFLEVLRRMGGEVRWRVEGEALGEPWGTIEVRGSRLHGTEIEAHEIPGMIDEVPLLALAATQASGETRIAGVGELAVKESDRLAGVVEGIRRLGGEAAHERGWLVVRGESALQGGRGDTRRDHRMAMFYGVAGLIGRAPVRLRGAEWVRTSFPGFWDLLQRVAVR